MTYQRRDVAEAAMHAWAETTEAPALALVQNGREKTFEILEADNDGVLLVRRQQVLIDNIWTRHSGGNERLTLMNAYSIACCYGEIRSHKQTILVEHETTDLTSALEGAIAQAHDVADWRATDSFTRTFVDAIAEGQDADPWGRRNRVPVPDGVSEEGPAPIVLIRVAGGRIDHVVLVRGHAHVVAVNRDGEGLDRGPHLRARDSQGEMLLTHWTGPDDLASLPAALIEHLGIRMAGSS
ncbi:MAG: hypothetical protein R3F54_29700 [Alphaproteobacteria bacterium]